MRIITNNERNQLLDGLIACWNSSEMDEEFYFDVHIPNIIAGGKAVDLTPTAQLVVNELRTELNNDEWHNLADLIRRRPSFNIERRNRNYPERRLPKSEREKPLQNRVRLFQERERLLPIQQKMLEIFKSNYLGADDILAADPGGVLLTTEEYMNLKSKYVRDWAKSELDWTLDLEQAEAVATLGGDVRVIARAGSGKTFTLVTRAIFLIRHCGVQGNSILLLAFNRKAADEMRDRLESVLRNDMPHVMTFHALAHALVHPDETLVFDDPSIDSLGLSRVVQDVIDEHVRSPNFGVVIQDLMLQHFRAEWDSIVENGFNLEIDKFLDHRRSLLRETLKGEYVKSHGEKLIANALFEHGVEYKYERNFRWSGINYRPDFTIPLPSGGGVVIEYFGIHGDPDYDEASVAKRKFWREQIEWTLVERSPQDLAKGTELFIKDLLVELETMGIPSQRLSEEDIWSLIEKRAIDRFTDAMKNFISRCRKRGLSVNDLGTLISNHSSIADAERSFLDVGKSVYDSYIKHLESKSLEDFDGLMWRAISLVLKGGTMFSRNKSQENGDLVRMRYVLVDEFQDFSQMFYELTSGIRKVSESVEFFCVGDDWQAINSFAGSDLTFFLDFNKYFNHGITKQISTNYRSPATIVDLGNAIMDGRGQPARACRRDEGVVMVSHIEQFQPSKFELERHPGDEITPIVLRLVNKFLNDGRNVVMLSRRNGLPYFVNYDDINRRNPDDLGRFLEHIQQHFPEVDRRRITISTTHKYKGLEEDVVIILDALEHSYPLIHPTWKFLRVFGESIDGILDENRRLFYVAVTRASKSLVIITETGRTSPYLDYLEMIVPLPEVPWDEMLAISPIDGQKAVICVFDAYDVKDELKQVGFQWDGLRKCWHRVIPAETWSDDYLKTRAWNRGKVRVKVYSEDNKLIYPI